MNLLSNSIILLTGADGGIGKALINELSQHNIKKIYATGLNLESLTELANQYKKNWIVPVVLNVTEQTDIAKIATQCSDVTILINNAGVELKSGFIGENAAQKALFEMKVNYLGVLDLINQMLPILKKSAQACIVNILSIGGVAVVKRLGTYCASKAAAHILTQTIREDLGNHSIAVFGVYSGYVNTTMSEDVTVEKATPETIAHEICKGILNKTYDIFTDKMAIDFFKENPIKINFLE